MKLESVGDTRYYMTRYYYNPALVAAANFFHSSFSLFLENLRIRIGDGNLALFPGGEAEAVTEASLVFRFLERFGFNGLMSLSTFSSWMLDFELGFVG